MHEVTPLLEYLPHAIRTMLSDNCDTDSIIEVVMDIDRIPEARMPGRTIKLGTHPVTEEDIKSVTNRIVFDSDNRAGIDQTLHRISAIKDRHSNVVGLTFRVGKPVPGAAKHIQCELKTGRSLLLLGPPGSGKTSALRDAAHFLSEDLGKRVIIVDTSNEIAGAGRSPHPAVGSSRRMQVTNPTKQHTVMIEAVENHTPEVIVIDEISNAADVAAARTIAQRGVQLIATAHGNHLENIMNNPTLSGLVGGLQPVVLGDDEAKRRNSSKSVLERAHDPTFTSVAEIIDFDTIAIHRDTATAVDSLLLKNPIPPVVRRKSDLRPMRVYLDGISQVNAKKALSLGTDEFQILRSPKQPDMILVIDARAEQYLSRFPECRVIPLQDDSSEAIANTLNMLAGAT